MDVTAQQLSDFEEHGVVHIRGVLTQDEIEALRSAVDDQIANVGISETGYDFEAIAHAIWDDSIEMDAGKAARFNLDNLKHIIRADKKSKPLLEGKLVPNQTTSSGRFIYDNAAWTRDVGVRDVAFDSKLPSICAALLKARYLNFWEDTTFVKLPGTRQRTAFHQDLGYFQIEGDQCVIAWLPLDHANQTNGVTEYVRGSHLWPETYASNSFIAQAPLPLSEGPRLPDIEGEREKYDIVSFDVQPGDAVICHVRTVHGSGGNLSDRQRRAISFRYCGDKVRYFDRSGALSQTGESGGLQNGDRLFSEAYPVVWPEGLAKAPVQSQRLVAKFLGLLEA